MMITTPKDELRRAFDFVEGQGYFDRLQPGHFELALNAWLRWVEKWKRLVIEDPEEAAWEASDIEKSAVRDAIIYGEYGWNRYFVVKSGEIVFSKSHAAPGTVEKAIEAGFRIWE